MRFIVILIGLIFLCAANQPAVPLLDKAPVPDELHDRSMLLDQFFKNNPSCRTDNSPEYCKEGYWLEQVAEADIDKKIASKDEILQRLKFKKRVCDTYYYFVKNKQPDYPTVDQACSDTAIVKQTKNNYAVTIFVIVICVFLTRVGYNKFNRRKM
jgi:hypothetical protein